jgi:hypothetical protein
MSDEAQKAVTTGDTVAASEPVIKIVNGIKTIPLDSLSAKDTAALTSLATRVADYFDKKANGELSSDDDDDILIPIGDAASKSSNDDGSASST